MPAYYAEQTIKKTVEGIPEIYDRIILCDDGSNDSTYRIASELGLEAVKHEKNLGYGGSQKTLYDLAKKYDPKIIAMIHPDNQYEAAILSDAVNMIERGKYDFIIGARMRTAKELGMPWWKRAGNRFLSALQRFVFGSELSEFHSGLRIFRADILSTMPYEKFSNDFVFDSQFIAWCYGHGLTIGELPAKCFYNEEVSSIDIKRSVKYGFATLKVLFDYIFRDIYKNGRKRR